MSRPYTCYNAKHTGMLTFIVPTDFNPQTVGIIDLIERRFSGQKLKFVFIHAFKLSDSIADLLMLSQRTKEYELIPEAFHAALARLSRLYPNCELCIDFFYGSTTGAFNNFLENHACDYLVSMEDLDYNFLNKSSIKPVTLFERCSTTVLTLSLGTAIPAGVDPPQEAIPDRVAWTS